ncbi:MAG TPA: valine--tRNA ligase [Steroidobacteraceae bacterium]|jgi:valyl-tRNA synthetase|nr:valine--tRNA ligase [Steroidobacteraceae bacterium]
MEKVYSPAAIEQRLYQRWEAAGYFSPRPAERSYCIVIPPPNVTGTLHMGHAFQDTIMDALIRLHRMRAEQTLWQVGTDHAGIATQMVVERQLNAEGKRRTELTREAFVERVWAWKQQSGSTIAQQLRRLGASVDWTRERFTMDPDMSRAVVEAFVRLHQEGLIYRGQRLVNWDPVLGTALSDLEVLSEEEDGLLWHVRYRLAAGDGQLVVATTRPETILGDVAVAVHPEDERYRALIGRKLLLPLTGREIPIIADSYVDPAFGTGCLKITPAHDFNDYAIGMRHGLPLINIFTPDARLNDNAPAHLRGLDRFQARERIVAELEAAGLLERIEPHRLTIPRGDRTGAVIEPYLTDQWYVRIAPLAAPAMAAVESGRVRFVPENWDKTFYRWMRDIQDWCISRQLWWGHRIPAWYDEGGEIYVARSAAEAHAQARARHGREVALRQDDDVLDTWFSSGLWPFSTQGWPEQRPELERYYPTNVLVTGFDIIFFWVARMLMLGLKFMGEVPFREVYLHGLILDADGQKMSKSKGNVIDPLDIIDGIDLEALVAKRTTGLMQPQLAAGIERATRKQYPNGIAAYGTDALRFTFASFATQSLELRFDLGRVAGYRNFCNKLWNAARFVMLSLDQAAPPPAAASAHAAAPSAATSAIDVANRWIRSRLGATISAVERAFEQYRFDYAASALYEFTWHEYCDWYLEIVKPVLQDTGDAAAQHAARRTLLEVLEALLRALHPLMPFISEDIWLRVAPLAGAGGPSIMLAPWPQAAQFEHDAAAETELRWLMQVVLAIRQIRGEMDISPARRLPLLLQHASASDLQLAQRHHALLSRLAGLESARPLAAGETAPPAAAALVGELGLLVPMAGLIEPASELRRLGKRLQKIEQELTKSRAKLAVESFVNSAPADVVEQERTRLAERESERAALLRQIEQVRALAQEPV